MMNFYFAAFQTEVGLTVDFAAKVFGVSRRTVTRWRSACQIPRSAARMIMAIRLRAAPWNSSFGIAGAPNYRRGMPMLAWEWRELLFAPPGGKWQDFRTWEERQRQVAHNKSCDARAAAEREARRLSRLRAARKGAATRKANKELRQDGHRQGLKTLVGDMDFVAGVDRNALSVPQLPGGLPIQIKAPRATYTAKLPTLDGHQHREVFLDPGIEYGDQARAECRMP